MLGALGGDPLGGGGGTVPELSPLAPLGVVSESVDDGAAEGVGLADPADGAEPGDADGSVDGTSVEETSTSELGWPDVGDVALLGGNDSGDVLGALDSPALVGDGCELATGLVESPGLPDGCDPDVGLSLDGGSALAESGDAELGGTSLSEGVLLGVVEDCPDSLPALEGPSELAGDVLSLVWLSLLAPLGDGEDKSLVAEGGTDPEPSLDGSAELAPDEPAELTADGCDDSPLASELEPSWLPEDIWLSDDGRLPALEARDSDEGPESLERWLGAEEISEGADDDSPDGDTEDGCELVEDAVDGGLDSRLPCEDWLGWDDRLSRLELSDPLDRSFEDADGLEGFPDDDGCDEAEGCDDGLLLGTELPLWLDLADELGSLDACELADERLDPERELRDDRSLSPDEPLSER